jgi:peptide/nickel transport system substrate-binding protein
MRLWVGNRLSFCAALLALGGLLSSCGSEQQPVEGLRIAVQGLPPTMGNPYRNTGIPNIYTMGAMFDGLTRIDAKGDVQPWLATHWENTGPLTWIFHLRDDVTFSNGVPLTAAAVVSTVDYLTSEYAIRELVARELNFIDHARAVDDYTVEFVTNRPVPLLPRSVPILYIVEPGEWERLGPVEFSKQPVGTGPFIAESFKPNVIELRAFEGSWRKPQVGRLSIIAILDTASRAQAVQSGAADIAMSIGPSEVKAIERAGGFAVTRTAASVWSINFVDLPDSPFKDRRVRQALNYAVDRVTLVNSILDGVAQPANQPGSPVCLGYNPDLPPIPYDPEAAKALLAEAGYADGLKFVVQGTLGSNAAASEVFQVIAQDLAKVGVEMEIRPITVAELIRNVVEAGWEGEAFSLNYNHEPSVDVIRGLNNHSCLWHRPWYCDQRIMPTIEQALVEFDPQRAIELRHEVMAFYREEYASLFLYDYAYFAGIAKGISGFEDAHGFINYEHISKAQ